VVAGAVLGDPVILKCEEAVIVVVVACEGIELVVLEENGLSWLRGRRASVTETAQACRRSCQG